LAIASKAPKWRAIFKKSVLPMRPPPEIAMIFALGWTPRISVIVWMPSC